MTAIPDDGDGIAEPVDTQPLSFSSDFSDGITTGSIRARGDQALTVTDAPDPGDGVVISADSSGGTAMATVVVCDGSATFSLSPGDTVVVTCSSVAIEVIAGTVEITFVADDGTRATVSLGEGNSLTFDSEMITFTAPAGNRDTVVVVVAGQQIPVSPGGTVGAAAPTPPTPTPPTVEAEELPEEGGLPFWVWLLVGLAVVAFVGGGIFTYLRTTARAT